MANRAHNEARSYTKQGSEYDDLIKSVLPTTTITDEEKHREALFKAREMEAMRDAETATLGRAFTRDAEEANAFSKLSRYETTIERGLYRALHELQRLQAARAAAGSIPPPVAVDVDVSGIPKGDR